MRNRRQDYDSLERFVMKTLLNVDPAPRLLRVAVITVAVGAGICAVTTLPFGDIAYAKAGGNGGGNGGGHGGGNSGGKGGGNSGGNAGDHGNKGGHSVDASASGGGDGRHNGLRNDDGSSGPVDGSRQVTTAAGRTADGSLSPSRLGKLNGFFHASSRALAQASPNSAIGRISQTFRDALSASAADETIGPTDEDLGAILAGATNKPVTSAQVQAIIDRLASENPDDAGLQELSNDPDTARTQGIADAANVVKTGDDADPDYAADN
jgi:hypothetical protein